MGEDEERQETRPDPILPWWRRFAPVYYKATIEIAESSNVPLIDVYSYFKDKEDYFADESHFNEEGHRLAARILYEQIDPIIP